MKKIISITTILTLFSFASFALDSSLDPNLTSGFSGAGSADMEKFVDSSKPAPQSATTQAPDCEVCHTVQVTRHANTTAVKGAGSATGSSSEPGTR